MPKSKSASYQRRALSIRVRKVGRFLESNRDRFRFDLGIRDLKDDWKALFSSRFLKEDLIAGLTVACIAIPLSLAIALASGVPPAVGLITAVIAGIVCAFLGGTPLAVSGPAAAMAIIIAAVVQEHGMSGLLFVGLGCGILQLLTGVLGLGKIARFVPLPVISGFTAGIGVIIFIGQLPRALGLSAPDQSHVFDVITHITDLIHQTDLRALGVCGATLLITFTLPRYFPRLPAPLIAVAIPSFFAVGMGLGIETIGAIPDHLPTPKLPNLPEGDISALMVSTFIVFAIASLETLLSSSAVDKIAKGKRHDPDQEMIGQGFGNMAVSLFGGIPVTGVIARSALNVHAGARSRRAAIIHALVLMAAVYLFAPVMSQIPVAVLAGILLSVALRMMHPREFMDLWRASQIEAMVYLITLFSIVFIDLMAGVRAGVIAALVIVAIRLGQMRSRVLAVDSDGPAQLMLDGPLTFLSSSELDSIRSQLGELGTGRGLIIDLSEVSSVDASGADQLVELVADLLSRGVRVAIRGATAECHEALLASDRNGKLTHLFALTESDVVQILIQREGDKGQISAWPINRLIYGVEKFRSELKSTYAGLFTKLGTGQKPHTLFITCSDSRISPNLITSTDPGELFVVRNVGNIIPIAGNGMPAEGAAIEYAVGVLETKEVIICGHSGCGAITEVMSGKIFSPESTAKFPSVSHWLSQVQELRSELPPGSTLEHAVQKNLLLQLQRIRTYPIIQEKMAKHAIRISAWYYDIPKGELQQYDEGAKKFVPVDLQLIRSLSKRISAGVQYQAP